MEPATFWTMMAAIATTLSACVIAWQSFETRKSAGQAKRSADASEAAVQAANDSLELGRQQTRHAELMAAEAIRSRMEVHAPSVSVRFADGGDTPTPVGFAVTDDPNASTFTQIELGENFWEPRNEGKWLFAIMRVSFVNGSATPVTITSPHMFASLFNGILDSRTSRIHLAGAGSTGSILTPFLLVGGPMSQWFRVTKEERRAYHLGGSTQWATEIDGETGVHVSQDFKIYGTLLRHGQEKGEYMLRGFGPDVNYPSRFEVEKQKRQYFIGPDGNGGLRSLPPIEMEESR